jgi:hypothetical protein
MRYIELIGHVDEPHRLHVELPPDVQPGPVKIPVQSATGEDEERDWLAPINRSWVKDWSDPREDVYTLEEGKETL